MKISSTEILPSSFSSRASLSSALPGRAETAVECAIIEQPHRYPAYDGEPDKANPVLFAIVAVIFGLLIR